MCYSETDYFSGVMSLSVSPLHFFVYIPVKKRAKLDESFDISKRVNKNLRVAQVFLKFCYLLRFFFLTLHPLCKKTYKYT